MSGDSFATLATIRLPLPCRLLSAACCPDKDLVVLITRLGGRDKISLWKLQGSRKWEVDIASDDVSATVSGLAWSPSGRTIAVVHDSARITVHSVQDGHIERSLCIPSSLGTSQASSEFTGVWWFPGYSTPPNNVIPDIFKRDGVKTGSGLSILKILPLLDPLQEGGGDVTATDLFAFQGTQTKSRQRPSVPDVISQWPSLTHALEDASIGSSNTTDDTDYKRGDLGGTSQATEENSLLIVADENGALHLFLDGSCFLGSITLPGKFPPTFMHKHSSLPLLLLHPENRNGDLLAAGMYPISVDIPLLGTPSARDFARLSSAARELIWYMMRVLSEVKEGWLGSASVTGARQIGMKWIQALERRLREQYGQESPNVVLELTSLLVTGSMTDGLTDFILSSEQTSDRMLQKWDSSVTDALTKMRNLLNGRIIPAFQRLHILLEEICGWSQMQHYEVFGLDSGEITSCLRMVERGIFASAWLVIEARKELCAFKHFLSFIRYETTLGNLTGEAQAFLDYDILEANRYLMSGFTISQIDRWFTGPAPQFNPGDLFTTRTPKTLEEALRLAYAALQDPSQTAWQPDMVSVELSHLDRNLEALVQQLAGRCQSIFMEASGAAARSAVVSTDGGAVPVQDVEPSNGSRSYECLFIRERVTRQKNEADGTLQYLAVGVKSEGQTLLWVSRMPYDRHGAGDRGAIGVTVMASIVDSEEDGGGREVDILDGEFFDDEMLVLVYRMTGTQGPTYIGTANYETMGYDTVESERYVRCPARKDMIVSAVEKWNEGHTTRRVPITRWRRLSGCKDGSVSLAVNGRVGRRVVCVLDGEGTRMEVLDIEGGEEEEDGEGEGGEGEGEEMR